MLDIEKLSSIPILHQNGWGRSHKTNIKKVYDEIACHGGLCPQVPYEKIFTAAADIIESLDGMCIKNVHTELGLGKDSNMIEFDYFAYDNSSFPELQTISRQIKRQVLFIGIGYDIIGDWLVDENGSIYFRDKIRDRLRRVSPDIYEFLSRDLYNFTLISGS